MSNIIFDDDEVVLLDCTPDTKKLERIHKINSKAPIYCWIVFLFFMGLFVYLLGDITAIIPLSLVFGPMALLFTFLGKASIKMTSNNIYDKYIITNKRVIYTNSNTNTKKFIYISDITDIIKLEKHAICFKGINKNKNLIEIRYRNIEDIDKIISIIEKQKEYI